MKRFFYPEDVCVIGVSDDPGNLGKLIVRNLINFGFKGRWHAVGYQTGKVFNQPIYDSVLDVPSKIDLAIILTRPELVPEITEECGKKDILRLSISTAGFSEYSESGRLIEKRLLEVCKKHSIRFIGPNCLAVVNMETGLCLPFSLQDPSYWKKGPVGVISQSGTVAIHASKHLSYAKVGIGKMASIGNQLDVDEVDLLEYFLNDPVTEAVFLYLESFSRPREFLKLAASASKPVILHKSNTSTLSQGVAKSHTNAVSGDDQVADFALKQAGIIRVRDMFEMLDCVKAALLPPLKGKRLAAISPGGGTAVMSADEAQRNGFDLPQLPETFLQWMASKGRAGIIALTNPLDLGDIYDLKVYISAIEKLLALPQIDGVFLDLGYSPEWAHIVSYECVFSFCNEINQHSKKPVIIRANVATPAALGDINRALSVPYFESMPGAFSALRKVSETREIFRLAPCGYQTARNDGAVEKIISTTRKKGKTFLEYEAYDILNALNVQTAACVFLMRDNLESLETLPLTFPVVLKAQAKDLFHKTDVGGVCMDLRNMLELKAAIQDMCSDKRLETAEGFLIQEEIPDGIEMIVGGRQDDEFGPVVVVGMGGVMVEVFSDVSAAPAPVDWDMAERMIRSLKGYPLLSGFRGGRQADTDALCRLIVKVSNLLAGGSAISEVDLNPVKVRDQGKGAVVVDCKLFLKTE